MVGALDGAGMVGGRVSQRRAAAQSTKHMRRRGKCLVGDRLRLRLRLRLRCSLLCWAPGSSYRHSMWTIEAGEVASVC